MFRSLRRALCAMAAALLLPLAGVHAADAAEMAEVAGSQSLFWPMHHTLFTHQVALDPAHLAAYAEELRIDARWAATALLAHTYASRVREDFVSGVRSGVNGTPTFYIDGERYEGSYDAEPLLDALKQAAA